MNLLLHWTVQLAGGKKKKKHRTKPKNPPGDRNMSEKGSK